MAIHNRKLSALAEGRAEKPDPDSYPAVCGVGCQLPPPSPAAKHQKPTVLPLSLGIFGVGFLLLSYFVVRRFASRRRSSPPLTEYNNNREDLSDGLRGPEVDNPIWYIRTIGLPQSVVDSIQIVRYDKKDELIETSDCSVCLSEFEEGEDLRLLPKCRHAFHVACIDTWLGSHTTCPLCRSPVDGNDSSSSGELGERGGGDEEEEEEEEEEEDDGVVIDEEEEVEAVRRSVSMDFSSFIEPNKLLWMKRSISFSCVHEIYKYDSI